jgi:glycosyltransferase involved in cell wall biosynthesis
VDPACLGGLGPGMEGYLVMKRIIPVTVLMPVCDTPVDMLQQAIDSILEQSFGDFEFLIVDDGSKSEETRECLLRQVKADARVRVLWDEHHGVTAALNTGLRHARGVFIARQDADDWSEPSRLEAQLGFLRAHPATGLCGTAAWTHQENGRRLWLRRLPLGNERLLAAFWHGSPFMHGSVMFRREQALSIGGYREEFPCSQDYDFLWRLTEAGGAANLSDALYHYRYASGSVSARRASEQARAFRAAQRLALARRRGETEDVAGAFEGSERLSSILDAALKQADHLMLAGAYGSACQAYLRLVLGKPVSGRAWAKLARCGLFVAIPQIREACFR